MVFFFLGAASFLSSMRERCITALSHSSPWGILFHYFEMCCIFLINFEFDYLIDPLTEVKYNSAVYSVGMKLWLLSLYVCPFLLMLLVLYNLIFHSKSVHY